MFVFFGGVLFATLLVCLQYGYIFKASVHALFPSQPTRVLQSCLSSGKGGKVPGSNRDCLSGQGPICSLAEPCTPCTEGLSCALCSPSNFGGCGFVDGYGPYCSFGGVVRPCLQCCS